MSEHAEKPCAFGCGRMIPDQPTSYCCVVCAMNPKARPNPADRHGVPRPKTT